MNVDEEPFDSTEDIRLDVMADKSLWHRFVQATDGSVDNLPLRWLPPGRVTDLYYQYTSMDPTADHASCPSP